jgi:hypothetical protein
MCAQWAAIGECGSNPNFMRGTCPVSCRLCQPDDCRDARADCAEPSADQGCYTLPGMTSECPWTCGACSLRNDTRCARNRAAPPAASGDSLERMFRRIVQSTSLGADGTQRAHVLSTDPWLLSIDDFLSSAEVDALLAAGARDFHRSLAGDGVLEARTSSTSWCKGLCLQDPTVREVEKRVQALTGVPVDYSEYMQVLRYEVGQYYKVRQPTPHTTRRPRARMSPSRRARWRVLSVRLALSAGPVRPAGAPRPKLAARLTVGPAPPHALHVPLGRRRRRRHALPARQREHCDAQAGAGRAVGIGEDEQRA